MSSGARVLITGAGGQLGGHAARLLATSGREVFGTTRRELGRETDLQSTVHWLPCDLAEPDQVRAAVEVSRPSWVLHAVGLAGEADFQALLATNVTALANLLQAVEGVSIERLLVIGSGAEYAPGHQREPIREDHPLQPSGRYGLTKLFQFELSRMALRSGVPLVYARPFNLIGPGVSCATAVGDISKRLAEAMQGDRPRVLDVGDLDRWRDYVDVRDAASACGVLLEHGSPGEVYNICSGVAVLLGEVVDKLLAMAGKDIPLRRIEGAASPRFVVGDASKLRTLGWTQQFDLETSLRDGLDTFSAQSRGAAEST
jgi:GDP-4-dehydro-6-deoxy-D-mannose reductase